MMQYITENIEIISKIIGGITAIIGFLYGMYKWILKPVSDTIIKTDIIYKEVIPNGGGSIKDHIKKIKENSEKIEGGLELLRNTQRCFKEDAGVAIFECTRAGYNKYVNRTYCKWIEVSKEELMGYGWKNFLASLEVKEKYDNDWSQAFAEGREAEFSIILKTASDCKIYCDVHAYPIKGISGEVEKYLGIISKEDCPEKLINK